MTLQSRALRACLLAVATSSLATGCATGGTSSDPPRRDAGRALDAGDVTAFPDAALETRDAAPPRDDAAPSREDAAVASFDAASPIGAPAVSGEPRADHRRPSWVWTTPSGAAGFRFRVDAGGWTEVGVSTTVITSAIDLTDGPHVFEVAARTAAGVYGPPGSFTTVVALPTRAGDRFWRTTRVLATTPLGHPAAISAHNAYSDRLASAAENLTATLATVHAAQAAGADLIELDVSRSAGVPRIEHDNTGSTACARLEDVLDDPELQAGDQVLFLEVKDTAPTEAFVRAILDLIQARREAFAHAGRPVVLRTFYANRATLQLARTLLDGDDYALIRPYVRLSVLFGHGAATTALVRDAKASRFDMVEFEYTSAEWMAQAALARSLGLGVNVWTVPVSFGEVFVANARESVDAITVDYPIAAARRVVTDDNAQLYLDASSASMTSPSSFTYYRTNATPFSFGVNGAGQPLYAIGMGDAPLFGGRLRFDRARSAATWDADARAGEGVLLATVVRFGTNAIADGDTMSVIAKTESGAWGLELYNPAGAAPTVLRFVVFVGGAYREASVPASALSTSRSHFITCAYDGDGGVRMWIDNVDTGVTIVTVTGGISNNDVPITLGADPQPGGAVRSFFDGEIQMALVQAWGNH